MIKIVIAIGAIVGMMLFWVLVQSLWKRTFSEYVSDDDAMSNRTKCANCHCTTACENKNLN